MTSAAGHQPARVLIVEDNFPVADSLRMVLQSEGYDVVALVGSVARALAAVDRGGFDVAVLDILVGADNIAPVAARVEAEGIPIIFISGYLDVDVLPEPLRGHPRLDKPCDPARLVATIEHVLADKRGNA